MSEQGSTVTLDDLLEHVGWVRDLARSLVRDADAAEDLVQHALMAGMRSPPRDHSRIRAWFREVLSNAARARHRAESAATAREAAVARTDSVPSAAELCERADAQRFVTSAVLRLPETYRTPILLRYYEGLSPGQIARRLGRPRETVRSQLLRGRALLRGELERRSRLRGEEWFAALVPLVQWRPGVREQVRDALRSRSGRVALRYGSIAACIAAVLMLGFTLFPARTPAGAGARSGSGIGGTAGVEPVPRPSGVARVSRHADAAAEPGAAEPAASSPAATPSVVEPAAPLKPRPRLDVTGEIVGVEGYPLVPVVVRLLAANPRETPPVASRLDLPPGPFTIDAAALAPEGFTAVEVEVAVDGPSYVPSHVRLRVPAAKEGAAPRAAVAAGILRADAARIVSGRVVDASGAPPAAARLGGFAIPDGKLAGMPTDSCDVDLDGAFRLRIRRGEPHAIVAASPGFAPALREVDAGAYDLDLGLLVLDTGATLSGVVIGPSGTSAARGSVAVVTQTNTYARNFGQRDQQIVIDAGEAIVSGFLARLDPGGTFSVGGLAARKYRITPYAPGVSHDVSESAVVEAVAPATLELRLEGSEVAFVAAAHGGASVRGTASSSRSTPLSVGEDGTLRFVAAPGVHYSVRLEAVGCEPVTLELDAPPKGERAVHTVTLGPKVPRGTWDVRLVDPGGKPVEVAAFGVGPAGARFPNTLPRTVRAKDGVLRLDDIPAGDYRVFVRPGADWDSTATFWHEIVAEIQVRPGVPQAAEYELRSGGRLRIAARDPEGRYVAARCRIVDASGAAVEALFGHHVGTNLYVGVQSLSSVGASDVFPVLAPGTFTVSVDAEGFLPGTRKVTVTERQVTEVELLLQRP